MKDILMNRIGLLLVLGLLFLVQMGTVMGAEGEENIHFALTYIICRIFQIIFYIAGAITALVIVVAGIKWIGSGDDPAARGSAKNTIVHAIIGLIIVLIAVFLVSWIIGAFSGVMYDPAAFILSDCGEITIGE